jgi:hypothetical protein
MSDSNSVAILERTSLIVYEADIFNCSRHEQRPNTGALFSNRDRAKNPKAPNSRGNLLIEIGDQLVELELSGWSKQSDKAGRLISLSAKLISVRPSARQPADDRDLDAALGNARGAIPSPWRTWGAEVEAD